MSGGGSLEALHWKLCFSPTRTVAFLGPSRITTPETKNRAHQWDGLVQGRHTSNSSALAMELYLSCTNSSNGYCERQVTPGCLQIWQYSVLHSSDTTIEPKARKLVRHSQFGERSSPAVKARAPTSSTTKLWSNNEKKKTPVHLSQLPDNPSNFSFAQHFLFQ